MDRAPIEAATLTWAREVSGLSVEQLAAAIQVKPEQVIAFEEGSLAPTMKQLIKVAKKLDRTPAFFFMPPPEAPDIPETVDFRQSPEHDGLDAPMTKALRRAERYREIMLEYGDTEGSRLRLPGPLDATTLRRPPKRCASSWGSILNSPQLDLLKMQGFASGVS
ncbi:helix-turn-helix transcriptional regulator [Corynebacterium aquatimens]|uniref:helix-turn-helix domain-containing protein n=1 Tax=Corynebacterium aquatimens TaxID=1190508 RepID=UPI0025425AE2|nr:helix-turn-helix transcriptional regulator [Corynebacterium aquatimens]QYH20206.1 helix-turn-helix transcriptional regulator [Corynebacterium aquatimens]